MAQMENIGGDSADRFQRYQMPRIQTKVEGKGNGIKTVFPNIYDVGLALKRDPSYITKYFGYEFGALSQYNAKARTGVVNGNHSWNDVHTLLRNFIRTFVLCSHCGNPETDYGMQGGNLTMHCLACGLVSQCPGSHRLTQSILKEIEVAKKAMKGGKAAAHAAAAAEREEKAKHKAEKAEKAARAPKKEKEPEKHEESGDEESADGALSADDDEEAEAAPTAGAVPEEAFRPPPQRDSPPAPHQASPIVPVAPRPAVSVPLVIAGPAPAAPPPPNPFEALLARTFEQGIDEAKLARATPIMKPLAATQMAQLQLLLALERYLHDRQLTGKAAVLVKLFYDADLLPEEVLLLWGDHPEALAGLGVDAAMDRALRAACAPLLKWLKEADEEDDDDEDEEEDEDEEDAGKQKPAAAAKANPKAAVDDFIDSL